MPYFEKEDEVKMPGSSRKWYGNSGVFEGNAASNSASYGVNFIVRLLSPHHIFSPSVNVEKAGVHMRLSTGLSKLIGDSFLLTPLT